MSTTTEKKLHFRVKQARSLTPHKTWLQRKKCRFLRIGLPVIATTLIATTGVPKIAPATATECPDLRVVFARGSGGTRWEDQNYFAYKDSIESKLTTTDLSYEFIDLDYPAVGVGIDKLFTTLGAFFGAGEAYEFGDSVRTGVKNLIALVNTSGCPNTKYILGGYSQGAMVISKALPDLSSEKLLYAATFGDPKLYLPEGVGIIPAACSGQNLSDYRMYVPDCQAYKGLLGAHIPYEPATLAGKVGTWCNKRDIFCSSHLNINDHLAYVSDNLYEDASLVIFDKISEAFGIENHISSPHDTAILIDSTGSMSSMIEKYKTEALRLATETLESGGRVALYDYRDLSDPYEPVQHCDFDTCTLAIFRDELGKISVSGGGDTKESLLSASLHVMKDLHWKYGATKSLVVLTDADFLSPDRDGATFDEVVALSKKIDPVNFYIITNGTNESAYQSLATATDGKVVTNFDELSLLTDYIMARHDSLPRVEEDTPTERPVLTISAVTTDTPGKAAIDFMTTGSKVLVTLNDTILGISDASDVNSNTIVIDELDETVQNIITLTPLSEDTRGESISIELTRSGFGTGTDVTTDAATTNDLLLAQDHTPISPTLKAPATGRR